MKQTATLFLIRAPFSFTRARLLLCLKMNLIKFHSVLFIFLFAEGKCFYETDESGGRRREEEKELEKKRHNKNTISVLDICG